tara:strand:- start:9387 stop:9629 length:243 start_codon:yes stop_codon:yes gene_type:complete
MLLFLLACHAQPTLDSDTGPLPAIALPCPAGQTLTLPRLGALDTATLDGGYVWSWLTGEGLTVECAQGGELEVQWQAESL